ncbi:hypothetical protein SIN8267_02815 [Sinobacterium norvegicum]|uniref:DUF2947 family protein n=1 Tax=Sinobacterium norvegicum TaxID=1641715 RepID=A0ABM9AHR9_9GAMM|nr:DUF2947 domain-containing protein [Sinobacterium norvegicum]CAH0992682.1 hypothetical protein SIN8267_02815 [Sinobacterium norvegicum]
MNYIPFDEYKKAWVFRHRDLPVSAEDLAAIKPMTPQRSSEVWGLNISELSTEPDHFTNGDWAAAKKTWKVNDRWQEAWDSEESTLPEAVLENIDWDDNTVVYFCYDSDNVIETTWAVFQRCWKNFLFFDDGPLLIGRKRLQVAQFFQNGNVQVGERKA